MNPTFFRLIFLLGLILSGLSFQAIAASQEQPEIKDIIVTTSETDLLLFASVKNGFTQEMLEGVKNGVPAVFSYQLELVKRSSKWLDTSLMESVVTRTLQYAPDKQEYRITLSDQSGKTITTRDLEQAKQLMSELNGLKIIPLAQLVPDAPYAIHFKVTLKKGALPLGMHRLLPVTSFLDFETDRRTIEFRY